MSRASLFWLELKRSFIVVLPITASTAILYITALYVTRRFWHIPSWAEYILAVEYDMNFSGNIRLSINNFYEMACQVTPVSYPWWLSHWLNCYNGIKHDHGSTGRVLESGWCLERMMTKKCANRAVVLEGLDTASCFVFLCLPSKLPWLEMHLFYGASTFFLE